MKPALHQLSLPGAMLARGFWLYVWEVTDVSGKNGFMLAAPVIAHRQMHNRHLLV